MKATPHNPVPVMDYQQYRRTRRLVHECCNYDGGNCLVLDDGEECVCVQSISYSLLCKWFRVAVLPKDRELEAALYHRLAGGMVDETVHKFDIKPHEDVSITFANVQYGRLKITKTVEGGGSVEGWQFKITDAEGKVLDDSPFSTDEDGIILTGNLLPGIYTIEELLPEDSLYECKGDNPQTVIITQGEVAEVAFVNALRTGKVTVEKIGITGSPLAGATFRLEWSEEGSLWYPVTYSESTVRGGCSNPDVTDGSLTTGADGILEWDNLYPGLQYRLTETKAPDGYKLLTKPAYEGELPADDLALSVRVTNTRTFTMPDTGASTGMVLRVLSMVAAIGCLGIIAYRKRKV